MNIVTEELSEDEHLVVQYKDSNYNLDTIAKHKEVIENKGKVWWAVFSAHMNLMATKRYKEFKKQTEENIETYAILSCNKIYHKAKVVDIKRFKDFNYPDGKDLIPQYYPNDDGAKVWLKLSSIEEVDESTLKEFVKNRTPLKEFLERPGQKHPIMYIKRKK